MQYSTIRADGEDDEEDEEGLLQLEKDWIVNMGTFGTLAMNSRDQEGLGTLREEEEELAIYQLVDCQYQLLAKLQYVVLSGSVTGFNTVYGIANFNSHGSLNWECFIVSHVLYF